jgi:hypothetical protein
VKSQEAAAATWPREFGTVVTVYVVDGRPVYTVHLDQGGRLVECVDVRIEA